jgi:MoaA/NifB/PqqE/SkfB family radical SAM enzyme
MAIKKTLEKQAILAGLHYTCKNPDRNLPRLLQFVRKFDSNHIHENIYNDLETILRNKNNNWNQLIYSALNEVDMHVLEKFVLNFILNSGIEGQALRMKLTRELHFNIPWAILMDPTSACNLRCSGCWAAEYGNKCSLNYDVLNKVVCEGKKLGTYFYIFSGGEPLLRKSDILALCREHDDCFFMAFSNGTLIDEPFAEEMRKVGNFGLALSVEGFEDATDMRRGKGVYKKVMKAMDILREYGQVFGYSTCYHRYNTDIVGSDAYVDAMIEKGARFAWYFTYIPVGKEAITDLIVTPDQREYMYRRVREIRATKPIFALDFWNDGEYVKGCIAGGREYFHINANGDAEPCAFIHYSNKNIKNCSLKEVLQSPLFMEYKKGQPFNENHLRPCPLLDNPGALQKMVLQTGAQSTEFKDPEDVRDLTEKCREAAQQWGERADCIWYGSQKCIQCKAIK